MGQKARSPLTARGSTGAGYPALLRRRLRQLACYRGGSMPPHEPADNAAPGRNLRMCRPDPPETLHPHLTNSFSGMEFTQMVYDNLTILDSNNLPTPQLATSWQAERTVRNGS